MARLVTAEGVPVPRTARKKPAMLVRGRRLKALNAAIHQLETLQNQDFAENARSAIRNYTPFLILGASNGKVMLAFNNLLKALKDAKAAKA